MVVPIRPDRRTVAHGQAVPCITTRCGSTAPGPQVSSAGVDGGQDRDPTLVAAVVIGPEHHVQPIGGGRIDRSIHAHPRDTFECHGAGSGCLGEVAPQTNGRIAVCASVKPYVSRCRLCDSTADIHGAAVHGDGAGYDQRCIDVNEVCRGKIQVAAGRHCRPVHKQTGCTVDIKPRIIGLRPCGD
ncbi:MAG: hypothetical protein MRJ96_07895 [Nitrospirales bacterium]|nr:hypothetical protein [Nitrospirales bacterium]